MDKSIGKIDAFGTGMREAGQKIANTFRMLKQILRLRKRLLRSWQKIWMYFETKYDMIRKESSIKGD